MFTLTGLTRPPEVETISHVGVWLWSERGQMSILVTIALLNSAVGQDAKPAQPPRIQICAPLAIPAGQPVTLALRGQRLDTVTAVKVVGREIAVQIKSPGQAAVPQNYDAARIGGTQLEAALEIPRDVPDGKLTLVAVNPDGESPPFEVRVRAADELVAEQEPNDALKTPQMLPAGKVLVGKIHEPRNVDVFAFDAQAGQKLTIQVTAASLGSPLDGFLTVFDETGRLLATGDDAEGRDPKVVVTMKESGRVLVCVQDASDGGGIHFAYLLHVLP